MSPIEPGICVRVFIGYSHADRKLRKKLEEHLGVLKHSREIVIWQDQEILPGDNWDDQIKTRLKEADVILLLVSASFFASQYCWEEEVQKAIERHKAGTARVIPIILRPVDWQYSLLGQLQALPTGAKPVTRWNDPDDAFEDMVRGIRKVVEDFRITLGEGAQRSEETNERIHGFEANVRSIMNSMNTSKKGMVELPPSPFDRAETSTKNGIFIQKQESIAKEGIESKNGEVLVQNEGDVKHLSVLSKDLDD